MSAPATSPTVRLSIMMFLQFFIWGSWFVTLFVVLGTNNLAEIIGRSYATAPIAAIIAPLFLGLVADRFFSSEKIMGALLLVGGAIMLYVPTAVGAASPLGASFLALFEQLKLAPEAVSLLAANPDLAANTTAFLDALRATNPGAETAQALAVTSSAYEEFSAAASMVVWLFIGHMLCYMPTLGLGNTIVFSHLPSQSFPKVRVWGTIGWIAAGLVAGFLGWSSSVNLFWMAAASSIVLGVYCFSLPNTPPPSAGKPVNLRAVLMLDAFKMLAKPNFLVFMICSTLICIPLAYYYANTSGFLKNMGFEQPASAMTIGQMSEIFFMLLIPFFFRKLGVKWMILIGMAAWILRYLLFSYGASEQVVWMLFAGIALHGICYDFFFVTGFMYTDRAAPKEVRGQAQSMLVFFTQGVGMFIGFRFADSKLGPVRQDSNALSGAIDEARGEQTLTFGQQLAGMFSVEIPEGVDPELIATTSSLWQSYWMLPALMATAIGVAFFAFFWDRSREHREEDKADESVAAKVTPVPETIP